MNKGKLLSLLAGLGYKGQESAEDITKWLGDNSIELKGTDGKDYDVAAILKAKSVVVDGEEDSEDDDETPDATPSTTASKRKAANAKVNTINSEDETPARRWSPESFQRNAERKAYNAKAARGQAIFSDAEEAEAFGAWARMQIAEAAGKKYNAKREDEAIIKTLTTTGFTTGEAWVPGEFMPSLIVNQEKYGVGRQVVGVTPMSQHTLTMPRLVSNVTISGVGQGSAMTATDTPTGNTVELQARKIGALIKLSNEFLNDSPLAVSSIVAESVGRSLGQAEDNIIFNGDGTSTYYGFWGICPALKGLSGTIANIASLVVASGNLFSEFVGLDFDAVVAKLPQYADNPRAGWVCHRSVAHNVMGRLAYAAGGNDVASLSGGWSKVFKGYNVTPVQVMPKTDANSQIAALFGDFSMACKFGVVNNSLSFETNTGRYFDEDVTAVRVTERVAFVAHDLGNVNATAASQVPGPVIGLISAAS